MKISILTRKVYTPFSKDMKNVAEIFRHPVKISALDSIIQDIYNRIKQPLAEYVTQSLGSLLNELKDDLWCYIELPYADRVYRDSYYFYFASKHVSYERDCIRISLFDSEIKKEDFRDKEKYASLQESFRGYFILRPTPPKLLGRCCIHPLAFQKNKFLSTLVKMSSMIDGMELSVVAMPHASQNGETLSCAETSIWSLMEYFGGRYKEYSCILPSQIHQSLSASFNTRQLPSSGLTIYQISRALKNFGFSSMIYHKDQYENQEFGRILHYYIESGIPVIIGLKNKNSGHATIWIGHEEMNTINWSQCKSESMGSWSYKDTADLNHNYIIQDDNFPPYQFANIKNPAGYSKKSDYSDYEIDYFTVPLYKRIYLDAVQARKLLMAILNSQAIGLFDATENEEVILRFFLTSSRSLKNFYSSNPGIHADLREKIAVISMPKFVWVAELSTQEYYNKGKAKGLVFLDATGSANSGSVLMIYYPDTLMSNFTFFIDSNKVPKKIKPDFGSFDLYKNNLKGEWNQWQA